MEESILNWMPEAQITNLLKSLNKPTAKFELSEGDIKYISIGEGIPYSYYISALPQIVDVIFHDPATIIKWEDGVKTVVKCQPGDTYDPEKGMMAAMLKKYMGNDNTFNKVLKRWLPYEPINK